MTLQSTSPSLLVLSASPTAAGTASITIHMAAGSQFATYYLQSLGSAGSASYTASAPTGYSPATGIVALAPSGVVIAGASNITIPLSGGAISLAVKVGYLDATGAPVAEQVLAGGPNLVVTLQNTTPATGTVPGTVTITAGTSAKTATFTPAHVGTTTVSVQPPPGWPTPTSLTQVGITVQ